MVDTSVIVAGVRSQIGSSYQVLKATALGRVEMLVNVALFLEYESVLMRAEKMQAHGLSLDGVERFLIELAGKVTPVEGHFDWRPQLADPDDEMVLDAAVNGRADAIVTHNERDFLPAARFGIKVTKPGKLLKVLAHE